MAKRTDPAPVQQIIDNAEEARPARPGPPALPAGCPVVPVGMQQDDRYYLDAEGQLIALPLEKHGRLRLMGLFCAQNELVYDYWPRKDAKGNTVGWRPEDAAKQLMALAASKGLWTPADKARGRGCWLDADGGLLVQCGTAVLAGGHWRRPGILGDQVLIARPGIMKPAPVAEFGERHGVGAEALELLRTWNWKRPIDPILLLGWIGCGFLGAALTWRPMLWVIGPTSTGKSTLQRAIEGIYGGWLVKAVEPTAAGVWQTLRHDCVPIAIDEAESDNDNRRLNSLVKLARACASGDRLLRGSSEGAASEYSLRSCVMFSSIRHPPLLAQDRSRIIILRLGEMMGEQLPDLAPARLRELGERILQRTISGWSRLPAALEQYRIALRAVGHGSRSIDVFGTALAVADVILNDEPVDSDSAAELAAQLDLANLPEAEDNLSDQEAWLRFLLSTLIPLDGPGSKNSVAEWLRQGVVNDAFDEARREADRVLGNHGIKILRPRGSSRPTEFAIANRHAVLDRLHASTHWAGRSGALGVYVQAARDLPGAHVTTQYFAGVVDKGTAIPLALAGLDEATIAARPAALFAVEAEA
jgi:hypothetical protein